VCTTDGVDDSLAMRGRSVCSIGSVTAVLPRGEESGFVIRSTDSVEGRAGWGCVSVVNPAEETPMTEVFDFEES